MFPNSTSMEHIIIILYAHILGSNKCQATVKKKNILYIYQFFHRGPTYASSLQERCGSVDDIAECLASDGTAFGFFQRLGLLGYSLPMASYSPVEQIDNTYYKIKCQI